MEKLGAIALSSDIFEKANIGLWAFELDEGSEPRMYVDNTMMKLIGLDHEVSPEETYHAWYDHIDSEHYSEVAKAVEEMTAGVHAEVQYPWHHPNGDTWVVRCGGVRNYAYTSGIRIEGTHQNVTNVAHFQSSKLGTITLDKDVLTKANIGLWAFELDEGSEPRMYADQAMMKLIGLNHEVSPEETYHAWYDNIDPKHYGEVANAVEKMTAGVHAEVQYPWHHPNGEIWTVRCGGVRNYAYTNGIRIEGTHQNVTALTHFEKRNLTDLLASLADNFVQVCFLEPYTGSVSYYSSNAFNGNKKNDYSKVNFYQDLTNRSSEIVHPDDLSIVEKMYSRENLISLLENGQPFEFTVRWLNRKNNSYLYMKNRLVPFEESDGTKQLVIGILDVTSEISAEKALEEKNAYLEHFLKSFQSAYIVDLANNTFEILSMDHELKHVFQTDGGKYAMNKFIEEHIHPDDKELMIKMSDSKYIMDLLKEENEITFTVREVYEEIEKTVRVIIMRGSNNERAAVGFLDISDEIEREKEHSRKLETANKAKSTFLFNMSHDIRTPMNAIIGFTKMAKNHINEKNKIIDCLNKVEFSSNYLLSLINDVLDMSRIESGNVKCEFEPTNIKETAGELIDVLRESITKQLTFDVDFSQIKHEFAYEDRLHTERILTNIISNSIKYTPDGGNVKFTVKETPTSSDEYYEYDFIVEDNGIGMSEEYLSHVFEEFSRENTSTMSKVQGTGLGMAITKKLVDLLGGTIEIVSKLNEGTKTTIHLKMKSSSINDVKTLSNNENIDISLLKGKKVLLVDDNELNREIAVDILKEEGMIVDTAEDGDIAVEKMVNANVGQYDLILMDIQMPRMNGYEATKAIRKLPNQHVATIPIIAMTANAFEEDKQNTINSGMNGHIAKPIDINKLLRTLVDVFD